MDFEVPKESCVQVFVLKQPYLESLLEPTEANLVWHLGNKKSSLFTVKKDLQTIFKPQCLKGVTMKNENSNSSHAPSKNAFPQVVFLPNHIIAWCIEVLLFTHSKHLALELCDSSLSHGMFCQRSFNPNQDTISTSINNINKQQDLFKD